MVAIDAAFFGPAGDAQLLLAAFDAGRAELLTQLDQLAVTRFTDA